MNTSTAQAEFSRTRNLLIHCLGKAAALIPIALLANSANALILDGGGTFNINTKVTGNNEDVVLYNGTLNLNPGGIIGNALYIMYSTSTANFVGGTIENYVYLNNGLLNIQSGEIHNDVASGISTWANGQPMGLGQVNIYGGSLFDVSSG